MQELKTYPRGRSNARQTFPKQDTLTRIKMVKLLEELITNVEPQRRSGNRICGTISAIDPELAVNSDAQYRQQLAKAAYALRDLKEWIGYNNLRY